MHCSFVALCALMAFGAAPEEISLETNVIGNTLGSSGRFGVLWDTHRHVWASKTVRPPTLDGKLDDACWADAAMLTGFIVGGQNAARPYRDRVLVCYDDQKLYLGCTFGEPRPERIKADVKENGVLNIWMDDCVEVHIGVDIHKVYSPKYDYPCWAQFITNTAGARFAQIRFRSERGTSSRQRPWNDQWLSASHVGKDAWHTEISIPWALLQLSPDEGGSFRMNVSRNRGNTTESWNTMAYHQPDKFGFVHFGGGGDAGIEIREAWVNCTEGEWTVTAEVVCPGTEPVEVVLRAEAGKDGEIVGRGQSQVVRVGSAPTVLEAPLKIEQKGAYDVMVKLASVDGKEFARGHAHGERKPLLERLFLFRTDFYEGEDVIRGYYRLTTLPQGRRLMAEFALLDGGETLARGEIARLSSAEGQFGFKVPPLPKGTPTFQLRVRDEGGKAVAQMERKLRVRKFVPIARERIHFHVDEPAGVARKAWPITAGIPFGQGMLAVEDVESHSRVLDAGGKELACQTRVVATWTDAQRYARWVHFDFQGDFEAGMGADFFVEFGTQVARSAPSGASLASVAADGTIAVDTGPLAMTFPAGTPTLFGAVKLNGKPITERSANGELYLKLGDPALNAALQPHQHEYSVDRSTRTLLAELCKEGYEAEIEYAGPIRSVVKASGWYGDEDGDRLFKYILRLYVHRGKSFVNGFHTMVATRKEQYVYSMGLRLRGPGRPRSVVFGRDGDEPLELPFPGVVSEYALIQPSSEYYRVLEYDRAAESVWGVQRASGRRAPGWCEVEYTDGSILVAVKDFWQEFPKELAVLGDGLLDVGFVGMRSPGHLDLRSSPFSKEEQATGSSEGVAKTTRFVLDFRGSDDESPPASERAAAALADLAVWVDPEWMQRADPFWAPVARCTPDSDDPLKRAYSNHVSMYVPCQPQRPEVVHGLPLYGMLNFGDRVHSMSTRGWFNNEDYAIPYHEWTGYLATGNRGLFDAVTSFTRHLIDVDTLNYTTGDPGRLGLQSRHKRLHWGQPAIVTHSYLDQSLLYYYLCGYERGLDHAELIHRGQRVWEWWPAAGWYTKDSPTGAVSRDYGVNLRILMNAYRHFWDPVLLVRAHELWARYAEGFTSTGDHKAGYFNVPRGVELYTRYTADPPAVAAVLKSDELCPVLSADLGQPEKLRRRLGEIEKTLASAHERLDVPWWALRHPIHRPDLDVALALGARERAQRSGNDVEPIVGGQLEFNGSRDIVFLEETDQEHEVRVRIWASGHADNAAATLLGPSGATISKKEFSTKDLPFATHGCVLTVKIPKDGVTGHYLLRLERLDGPYMRCWLTEAPQKRVVLVKGEEFELGAFWGTRFWFHVPQDCTGFRIEAKPWNRATRFGFAVYDGQGRFVDAKGWYYNSQIDKLPTHWLDIKVPADARGTWWSIPYTCAKGIHFIWPKELPPYLADSPTSGFLPDPEYLRLVAGRE